MGTEEDKTPEGRFLDKHPEIRSEVIASREFRDWIPGLPTVIVDDIKYYIRGGDMLKDEDEIVCVWARRVGLPSSDEVAQQRSEASQMDTTED